MAARNVTEVWRNCCVKSAGCPVRRTALIDQTVGSGNGEQSSAAANMAGYVSQLFDLGESRDDAEVEYSSLQQFRPDSADGASTPDTVKPREVLDEVADPDLAPPSPFRPAWMYGYNPRLPVLSLYTTKEQRIAFAGCQHVVSRGQVRR